MGDQEKDARRVGIELWLKDYHHWTDWCWPRAVDSSDWQHEDGLSYNDAALMDAIMFDFEDSA